MTKFLPLPGTWGWDDDWWQKHSRWLAFMASLGCEPYDVDDPFEWSTRLSGLPWLDKGHHTWRAEGLQLRRYVEQKTRSCVGARRLPVRIIAHSHAGQLVAYAAQAGLEIDVLLTVSTPVRDDMRHVWADARPRIGHWRHIHGDWSDRMAIYGAVFDGLFGRRQRMEWPDERTPSGPYQYLRADQNVGHTRGHSYLFNEPGRWGDWQADGHIDSLRFGGQQA